MPLFTTTSYGLKGLVEDIARGALGLPDLQRPFVWPNVNVRNLLDSLYRGYPAGYLLFWKTGAEPGTRAIGEGAGRRVPDRAIVDGQQRLTSLYAVMRGEEVLRADFRRQRIRIAFDPLKERFDVADASTVQDKAYIPDVARVWAPGANIFALADEFVADLRATRPLSDADANRAKVSIGRLQALQDYSFTALELDESVPAEVVAEVFVRINGEGKKLNQADFILTLMSVFWDEGRTALECFARDAASGVEGASARNRLVKPSPDQMLRVGVALGLGRARLESVYSVLRGRDAATGEADPAKREAQFNLLRVAQARALNLNDWHHFLGGLVLAGYRHDKMISSVNAVIYCYALYLIGVINHGVERSTMQRTIAEFFFMASLTGRYTNSPESAFEFDLARLREARTAEGYVATLRQACATALTNDYWEVALPNSLASSASRSPSRFAYQAALMVLDARALYGHGRVVDMVDVGGRGVRAGVEQHHLFPKGYLKTLGVTEPREINQIANYAVVEWPDNARFRDRAPAAYAPPLDAALPNAEREVMRRWHALPVEWWAMGYADFLRERRVLMARVIREAYERLSGASPADASAPLTLAELLAGGESDAIEFKSTLRTNLHTGAPDERMQLAVLKTLAGFLNARGGTLIVGAGDDGRVLGIAADGFSSEDKMALHLVNLVRDRMGELFQPYLHSRFEEQGEGRVLVVTCDKGPRPCFVKDGPNTRFFVRGGNATGELTGAALTDYVRERFR